MHRAAFLLVTAGLSSTAVAWSDAQVCGAFRSSPIVALVQVQASTFPKAYRSADDPFLFHDASATLLVIASWKGPYHSGATLHAAQPMICGGYPCLTYPFQTGEITLVFAREYAERVNAEVIVTHPAS